MGSMDGFDLLYLLVDLCEARGESRAGLSIIEVNRCDRCKLGLQIFYLALEPNGFLLSSLDLGFHFEDSFLDVLSKGGESSADGTANPSALVWRQWNGLFVSIAAHAIIIALRRAPCLFLDRGASHGVGSHRIEKAAGGLAKCLHP